MNENENNKRQFRRIEQYASQVENEYLLATKKLIALIRKTKIDSSTPFLFEDYPELDRGARKIFEELSAGVRMKIVNGITSEWEASNIANDQRIEEFISKSKIDKLPAVFFGRNKEARDSFVNRTSGKLGLNLSKKIWRYTEQFRQEVEMSIDVGVSEGRSAAQISRDIRKYLHEPDKLFRRVRDKRGVLRLSKNAKAYHPGQGVYRSSYKNAMRLARTETNMAYRTADHLRWQKLPFVQGFEVKLSNNHPVEDICDELKGKYPKDFKFVGWHPNCRCYVVSVLPTEQEYDKIEQAFLNGETDFTSSQQIDSPPEGFKKWVREHQEQLQNAEERGTLPFFVIDNQQYVTV